MLAGEELVFSYIDVSENGPEKRRDALKDYGFHCMCHRSVDDHTQPLLLTNWFGLILPNALHLNYYFEYTTQQVYKGDTPNRIKDLSVRDHGHGQQLRLRGKLL